MPTDPPCGCGYIRNHEEVEGRIAFIDRGDCSFVSKAGFGKISANDYARTLTWLLGKKRKQLWCYFKVTE